MTPITRGALASPRRIEQLRDVAELSDICLIDNLADGYADIEKHRVVAERLGVSWPGTDIYSLQVKYVAMAVGGCDAFIRIHNRKGWREAAWDHAGGVLIVEEIGGKVTDLEGKPIDFGEGRRIGVKDGLVAASAAVHDRVLEAARQVLAI
jgi:3'(2'), 5'-bisphosphate nucleotidase